MGATSFELRHRYSTGHATPRDRISFWGGEVGGLGTVELVLPALELVPVHERSTHIGALVTGESVPPSSFVGWPYSGRPRLAEGRLSVAGRDAAFERNAWRADKEGRALRIWAVGREYTYLERQDKRHHALVRDEAKVEMARSSWREPKVLSGSVQGAADSVDISLAILFEGVYARDLSLRGALISAPGRIMDRMS